MAKLHREMPKAWSHNQNANKISASTLIPLFNVGKKLNANSCKMNFVLPTLHREGQNTYCMIFFNFMYILNQSNWSFNIPLPGIPRAFDAFSCSVGREFDELSPPRGRAFDHHSQGVGNLIASFDFMLRAVLIPCGLINHGRDGGDKLWWIQRKDCRFMADWLKFKSLHKLYSVLSFKVY